MQKEKKRHHKMGKGGRGKERLTGGERKRQQCCSQGVN